MPASPAETLNVTFAPLSAKREDVLAILVGDGPTLTEFASDLDDAADGTLTKAAEAASYKGKKKSIIDVLAPAGLEENRILLVGSGTGEEVEENEWVELGGATYAKLIAHKATSASFAIEAPEGCEYPAYELAAMIASGAYLRSYKFDKYKSKKSKDSSKDKDGSDKDDKGLTKLVIHCPEPKKAEKAFARHKGVADGVLLARDLVNEPANELGPVEFAKVAEGLSDLGVEVEILEPKDIKKLKMGALMAVAQGSARPARVAIMKWNGGRKNDAPLAFVGKGVVFDTGGISIKPSSGMEDMKGDMGGAACVTGLMHALAARKAKVNAIGIIGCVENMPSGEATRPGDIVESMSGQTVEILNTDAEGRLVLADIMWYVQDRYKPQMMVDLATLTGAIMVALGKSFAGVFCNNDELAENIAAASEATGEKTWRMPLDKSYQKMIDSKNADVKNLGGRWGGACTAAAFLERFVKDNDTPWAHIDLAGTAMDAPRNDINPSWGSGWGVRLLDRLVSDQYE